MNLNQISVRVILEMTIEDKGQTEKIASKAPGTLYKKGKMDVLIYEEGTGKAERIKSVITILPDSVSIKRTGAVQMHQQFRLDRPTANNYRHPHGYIQMETNTKAIQYRPLTSDDAGLLKMNYDVALNGQEDLRNHQLLLHFTEEDLH